MKKREATLFLLVLLLLLAFILTDEETHTEEQEPTESDLMPITVTYLEPAPEVVATYNVPLDYDLQLFLISLCEDHHIEPEIVIAMIRQESGYQADAIGDGGDSEGLLQVQRKWHQDRMDKLGCTDLLNPYQNITVAVDYLAELLDKGNGLEWALTAYNGGMAYADKVGCSSYASEVLAMADLLKGGDTYGIYSDDPGQDAERFLKQEDRWLAKRPVCTCCCEHIQDDFCYQINDENICEGCMNLFFRKAVEDLCEF